MPNMENATPHKGYRLYWTTWLGLLALTALMLGLEFVAWSRWALLAVLLIAMTVKAGFIAGNFMHLRLERPALVWIVAGSLFATALVLFLFLAADAQRVLRLSAGQGGL
jgi:cytochrome c oxidase subunit IV